MQAMTTPNAGFTMPTQGTDPETEGSIIFQFPVAVKLEHDEIRPRLAERMIRRYSRPMGLATGRATNHCVTHVEG